MSYDREGKLEPTTTDEATPTVSESVIPDAANEPEPSPAVVALRKEVAMLQNAVFALGESHIKAKEGHTAHELLSYLDGLASKKMAELDSQIASEILQTPVQVEGGSKISVAH